MSLAERIRDYVREQQESGSEDLHMSQIATELGESEMVVGFVISHFHVTPEGEIDYAGPNLGGGWLKPVELTAEDVLHQQLVDNVITQQEHDDRLALVQAGKNPRDAEAMAELLKEREELERSLEAEGDA